MQVLEKVNNNPSICGIELDFTGELSPTFSQPYQNFFNSKANQLTWVNAYFGKRTVSFSETSKIDQNQNLYYIQTVSIKFPSNDAQRSERINVLSKVKFVKITLTNGSSLVIGRNDFFQNKKPKFQVTSDEKSTTVKYTSSSIFPTGFAELQDISQISDQLLPAGVPLTFSII